MTLSIESEGDPMTDHAPPDVAALARLYGRQVFQAAYRVLGQASQAEDLQQDVFLRVLERPTEAVESWPAYLTTLTVRMAIDRLRKAGRWRRLVPTWRATAPAAFDSTEQSAIEHERARQLRDALGRLKPREAECFTLRHVQGMEIAAIAAATGMSSNHVSVCLHRASRALEARLGGIETDTTPEVL
ncbi:sigma-70 family RNA polymerase sigma factor [Dyella sp.]|jgi:RNA polymerase sigma-70 factor (ECF subfamily)|uniref:RNA polymerase sigma factor n=1 Tax=Dyella sp. TaxID=1869338 RepID=UPI002D772BE4|nr:sigma-70 family RNA polymerase sigma factor [Dyella sp.]HET6431629.1 sigma-70 family RNA polymerase sigma factor [Dyella sp.]